jgi:hypothetical protein
LTVPRTRRRYDTDKKKGVKPVHGGHAHGLASHLGAGGLTATLGSRPNTAGPGTAGHQPAGTTGATGDHAAQEHSGGDEPSLSSSYAGNSDSAMLLRVWNVKKSDPTVPVFVKSLNRRLAAIKPRWVCLFLSVVSVVVCCLCLHLLQLAFALYCTD